MTMTLEFPPDLQAQLEQAAAIRGITPEAFVIEATRRALADVLLEEPHQSTTGSLAGSDALLADKHAEEESHGGLKFEEVFLKSCQGDLHRGVDEVPRICGFGALFASVAESL